MKIIGGNNYKPTNFHDFLDGYPNGPVEPKHCQPMGWAGAGEPVYILGENGKMYETRPTSSVLRSLQPCADPISTGAADHLSSPEHSKARGSRHHAPPTTDAFITPCLPASSLSLPEYPCTSTHDHAPSVTPDAPKDPCVGCADKTPQADSAREHLGTDVVEEFLVEHRKLPKPERFDISPPRVNGRTGLRTEPSRIARCVGGMVDVGAGVGKFEQFNAIRSNTKSGVSRLPNGSSLPQHRNIPRVRHSEEERIVVANKPWSIRWDDDPVPASASRSTDTRKQSTSMRKANSWEPVTKLTEMGFDEVVARNALQAAAGDVQKAIRYASSEQAGPLASWTWESEQDVYIPFDPHVNKLLHDAEAKKLRLCTYKIKGVSYTADLEKYLQKNNAFSTVRRIRPPEVL